MTAPLTPWVPLYDVLSVYAPELIDTETGDITGDPATVAMWETAIAQATWSLWTLTGGMVHPSECWIEDYSLVGSCEVRLVNTPLLVVAWAQVVEMCGGSVIGALTYCVKDVQTVSFCASASSGAGTIVEDPDGSSLYLPPVFWGPGIGTMTGCNDTVVRIGYTTDSTLPPGSEAKVAWLADQIVKAQTGDKSCSLPERVQSVTRQGVSWTTIDPMDYLNEGMTGMGRIDSWLVLARMNYPRTRLIDPLKTQRRRSRRVDCYGSEFAPEEFGDLEVDDLVVDPFNVTSDFEQV